MYPSKNDSVNTVKEDLIDFDLDIDLNEIKKKSKNSFKKLIKKKMKEYALGYLNDLKETHSKMDNLVYTQLKIQNYLKDKNIPVHEAKVLFNRRTRAALFKSNYGNSYWDKTCPFCRVEPDSQAHALECDVVQKNVYIIGDYEDIFSDRIPSDLFKTVLRISKCREEISLRS